MKGTKPPKSTARARVDGKKPNAAGLIPQPHGGALLPRPPAGAGSSWKAARKAVLASLAEMTPAGVEKLKGLMSSVDDRVAMVAVKELLDRTLGKPGELPQVVPETAATIDIDRLTPDQQRELAGALAAVRRLAAIAQDGTNV